MPDPIHPFASIARRSVPVPPILKIRPPALSLADGKARVTAEVSATEGHREIWYETAEQHAAGFVTDRCDGFVVGLLFQAMRRGADIVVHGAMSSQLWHSLTHFYIPMMSRAFPALRRIAILPEELITQRTNAAGVATGFSAGIDSFAAVIQHFDEERHRDHRVSHFLFNNVGSHGHGTPQDDRRLFLQRYEAISPIAAELGIPVIQVDSNIGELFPSDFIRTHHALNAAVPLALQNLFQRFYYASAYKYADCGVMRTDDIARFDPFAVHLFSTESLDCVSSGGQMSRVEKTAAVADYEPSYRYLNVCVDPAAEGANCSVCFKCSRTILTLELLGKIHLYERIFDREKFRTVRGRYIRMLFRLKPASFENEITDLAIARSQEWWVPLLKLRRLLARD